MEQAERLERLQLGAEALRRLKPHEIRALVLRAEGHSYDEIARITGWTYTKVNRCLSEGRRAFLERLHGIEAGDECERLAPHLSALADGEATSDDMAALRAHLRSCLSCRARLREFRHAPARVAALVPPAALVGATDVGHPLRAGLESIAASFGDRVHQTTELMSGSKVAAVAASAALVAGGGAATVDRLGTEGPQERPRIEREQAKAESPSLPPELIAPATQPAEPPRVPQPEATAAPVEVPKALGAPSTAAPAVPKGASAPAPRRPDPANEFAPGGGGAATPGSAARSGGGGSGGGGGGGEFGP